MSEGFDFEKIYLSYWEKVYRLCMAYVNDDATACDLAQESFILVWEGLPKFRGESNIGTWIFRITTNYCLRQIEKERRMPKTALPVQLPEELVPDRSREVELLYGFISELPETDRIIISLELEDIKQSEIAQITGFSEDNIRVKIHRIKKKLRQKFKEYGY